MKKIVEKILVVLSTLLMMVSMTSVSALETEVDITTDGTSLWSLSIGSEGVLRDDSKNYEYTIKLTNDTYYVPNTVSYIQDGETHTVDVRKTNANNGTITIKTASDSNIKLVDLFDTTMYELSVTNPTGYTSSVDVSKGQIKQDKSVSVTYTPVSYNVAYDANNGTGNMSNSSTTYDTDLVLSKNTFTREGYAFAGWNTSADGSGESYEDGAIVSNLTSEENGTVTLYAQWEITNRTLGFTTEVEGNMGDKSRDITYLVYLKNTDNPLDTTVKYTIDGEEKTGTFSANSQFTISTKVGCDISIELPYGTSYQLSTGGKAIQNDGYVVAVKNPHGTVSTSGYYKQITGTLKDDLTETFVITRNTVIPTFVRENPKLFIGGGIAALVILVGFCIYKVSKKNSKEKINERDY